MGDKHGVAAAKVRAEAERGKAMIKEHEPHVIGHSYTHITPPRAARRGENQLPADDLRGPPDLFARPANPAAARSKASADLPR